MKKISLLTLPAFCVALCVLTGCGGNAPSSLPASLTKTALKVTVTVPSGTSTKAVYRAAGADVPLPGATIKLYDLTTQGAAALSGSPVATSQTDANGTFTFLGLTAGHNYMATATKTVTDSSGNKITLSLGVYAHIAANSSTTANAAANFSSTVAASYIIQTLTANPSEAGQDLTTVFNNFVQQVLTLIQNGTITSLDLSKPFTDPTTYTAVISTVTTASIMNATYIDDGNGTHDYVSLMVSKSTSQVIALLLVLDATGNVYDADYYLGALSSNGTFSGTTTDGLYTINGTVVGNTASGNWAAVNGTLTGYWEAMTATGHTAGTTTPTYRSVGYAGDFYKSGDLTSQGRWLFFVDANGKAVMMAHDEKRTNITHLQRTAVVEGTVSASGAVTGNMVFPIVTAGGTLTGTDAAEGGATTGTASSTLGTHTASGTVNVTGSISALSVTGTWGFSGLRDSAPYTASGTWNGQTF